MGLRHGRSDTCPNPRALLKTMTDSCPLQFISNTSKSLTCVISWLFTLNRSNLSMTSMADHSQLLSSIAAGHSFLTGRSIFWFALIAFCLFVRLPTCTAAPLPAVDDIDVDEDYQLMVGEELEEAAEAQSLDLGSVGRPIWVNPCGVDEDTKSGQRDGPLPTVAEAVEIPLLEIKIALRRSRQLTHDFAQEAFREKLAEVLNSWSHIRYDWLPDHNLKHKDVGERLSQETLDKLELDTALREIYMALQKVAVAMEQAVLDQALYGSDFLTQFKSNELKLRTILCSVQSTMSDLGVLQSSDAARRVMAQEYRDLDSTSARDLRDFIILREYTNVLEYAQQVLQHFQHSD